MVRRGHVPQRMCIGCGKRSARRDLVRLRVDSGSGDRVVKLDRSGTGAGRGAWLCASRDCLEQALRRDLLRRRLGAEVRAEELRREFADHITATESANGKEKGLRDS